MRSHLAKLAMVLLTSLAALVPRAPNDVNSSRNVAPESAEKRVPDLVVPRAKLKLMPMLGQWHHEGAAFSGFAVKHHANGREAERTGFVDGKREGVSLSYYPNGARRKRSVYVHNRLNGAVEFWAEDGTLLSRTHYEAGVMHGTQQLWYRNGAPFKHRNLSHGQEQGLQRAWRRNGKLYVNYEARDGRVFGMKRSTLCYSLEDEVVTSKKKSPSQ